MIVDTVAGVLLRNGRVLVEERRTDDSADPGLIVVPGGHVELGETLEAGLRREMWEELGVRISRMRLVVKRLYTASDGERQRIHYFHVTSWKGRIRAREAERVFWTKPPSLSDPRERRIVSDLSAR